MLAIATPTPTLDPDAAARLNELVQQHIRDALEAVRSAQAPPLEETLQNLTALPMLAGGILCLIGVLYLLLGWRIFKFLLIINAAVFGTTVGGMLVVQAGYEDQWWIGMLAGGVVLGVLAWPLMKLFLALLGAAAGALAGYVAFGYVVVAMGRADILPFAWAGAVAGGMVMFLLTFVTFRFCVMVLTAMQGSSMLICGGLSLALKFGTHEKIAEFLGAYPLAWPGATLTLGTAGLIYQFVRSVRHRRENQQPDSPAE